MAETSFGSRVLSAASVLLGMGAVASSAPTEKAPTKRQNFVAGPPPVQDQWPRIMGPSMTPAAVSTALREAERGHMRWQCELLAELREKHTHLHSELQKRESTVASGKLTIAPATNPKAGKRQQKRAQDIADYCAWRLGSMPNLADKLLHLAGADFYGRTGLEIVWDRDAQGVYPKALEDVHPHRLAYDEQWRVRLYDEAGNSDNDRTSTWPGVDIRGEYPGKFIIHAPRTLGPVVTTRQGLGRVIVFAGMFWLWTTKQWMQFAELFAMPRPWATFDRGADETEIADIKAGLIQMSGLGGAVFPETCKPQFLEAKDTEAHGDLAKFWNSEVSKVINGATLATETQGGAGSRALGEVHERAQVKIAQWSANALCSTLDADLLTPLVTMQFGADALSLVPHAHIQCGDDENSDQLAGRVWAFVDRGGTVDMDEARSRLTGMAQPAPKAPLLQPLNVAKRPPAGDDGDKQEPAAPATEEPQDDEESTDAKD